MLAGGGVFVVPAPNTSPAGALVPAVPGAPEEAVVPAPKKSPLAGPGDPGGASGASRGVTASGTSAGRSLGWTGACASQTPMTGTSGSMNAESGGLYLRSIGL